MKKFTGIIAITFIFSGVASASDFTLELKALYFSPTEQAFKDIYGGGLMYRGEVSIGLRKNLDLWLGGGYFSKKGELTFTKEETKLQIVPIGGGLKYRIATGNVNFYGGIGLYHFQFKESNPIGDVSKGRLGYVGKIGAFVEVVKGLIVDVYFDNTYCKMQPADFKINIGGIEAGIGIGYVFDLKGT